MREESGMTPRGRAAVAGVSWDPVGPLCRSSQSSLKKCRRSKSIKVDFVVKSEWKKTDPQRKPKGC